MTGITKPALRNLRRFLPPHGAAAAFLAALIAVSPASGDSRQSAAAVYGRGGREPGAWNASDYADLGMFAAGGGLDQELFGRARRLLWKACPEGSGGGGLGEGFCRKADALLSGLSPDAFPGGGRDLEEFGKAVRAAAACAARAESELRPFMAGGAGGAAGSARSPESGKPAFRDPLAAEIAVHLAALRDNWLRRDRLTLCLSLRGMRSANPGKFAEILAALRDPRAFRARGLEIAAAAADLPSGQLHLFIVPKPGGAAGPEGLERLAAAGRLDAKSASLGPDAMRLWLNTRLRKYFVLSGVSGRPSSGDYTVPVMLDVRSGDAPSFLTDAGRSPWKILFDAVSLGAEVTSDGTAKLDVRIQTLSIFSAVLPGWLRMDLNADFAFESGKGSDRRNVHEMNLLAGASAFAGGGLRAGGEGDLSSLLPGILALSVHGTLEASEDWERQDASSGFSLSAFFPCTPFDLLGVSPGTPRAIHESYMSLALSAGFASRIAGAVRGERNRGTVKLEFRLSQPLPLEIADIAAGVIGNDDGDAEKAGERGKGGDEISFPIFTIRWRIWWHASFDEPVRLSFESGFFSAVELELKIPLGAGLYAFFSYRDGSMPLFEKGAREFSTGIELSL